MPADKWRFAIGTTSRVPGKPNHHYLILDFDNVTFSKVFVGINTYMGKGKWIAQPTASGWHVYTDSIIDFTSVMTCAEMMGADPAWLRIGEKRGYLFLADKAPVPLP